MIRNHKSLDGSYSDINRLAMFVYASNGSIDPYILEKVSQNDADQFYSNRIKKIEEM
jgi:hypothetical protein